MPKETEKKYEGPFWPPAITKWAEGRPESLLSAASSGPWFEEPERGWPGDGSGLDDLADYNANEANDYRNEGE